MRRYHRFSLPWRVLRLFRAFRELQTSTLARALGIPVEHASTALNTLRRDGRVFRKRVWNGCTGRYQYVYHRDVMP